MIYSYITNNQSNMMYQPNDTPTLDMLSSFEKKTPKSTLAIKSHPKIKSAAGVTMKPTFGYDNLARLDNMSLIKGENTLQQTSYSYNSVGLISNMSSGNNSMNYTYSQGYILLTSKEITNNSNNVLVMNYNFDNKHRLLGVVGTANNVNYLYNYELNEKNQRTKLITNDNSWTFNYNDLGEVIEAQELDSNNIEVANRNYIYNYDLIGNRISATEGANIFNYTSNLLNQYTQINNIAPTYDLDGNTLTNNGWTYTYNGENRLIEAQNADTRLEFAYDYMGRRIFKKVYENNTLISNTKFVYNGYKLIAEFDTLNSNNVIATYTWNQVYADTPAWMTKDALPYYYLSDGNKNTRALFDVNGTLIEKYDYTPFGQLISNNNSNINPFKFSSEYHDIETDLIYYNYRYYNPLDGRWLNRDPIEEQGGINLYLMSQNNTINYWDILGYSSFYDLNDIFPGSFDGPGAPNRYIPKPTNSAKIKALQELTKWYARMIPEMTGEFIDLCTGVNESLRKDCIKEGTDYARKIIKGVRIAIYKQIIKFGDWPTGGIKGNFLAKTYRNGLLCSRWAEIVDDSFGGESGEYFIMTAEISDWYISNHAWTSVTGPCNKDIEKPDFGIDFWEYGGRENNYTVRSSKVRNTYDKKR